MKLSTLLLILSLPVFAVPTFEVDFETTPIPQGIETTDDAVVYQDKKNPENSVILGVSKNKKRDGGMPGLGVYDLNGVQLQFFQHDRLNNIDLRSIDGRAYAIGSNRDKKAISVLELKNKRVRLIADLVISNDLKIDEEPYGFCAYKHNEKLYAVMPMKSGLTYIFRFYKNGKFKAKLERIIDLSKFVTPENNAHTINITIDDVIYEGGREGADLAEEIKKEISERYQLEGCTASDEDKNLYIGMEQLGIFKIDLDEKKNETKLILKTEYSKEKAKAQNIDTRFTNDIEGLDLYTAPSGNEYIIVSIQGISEFAILDRKSERYIGSFKLAFGKDKVTQTDGLAIHSGFLGEQFPAGVLVVHDHINTDQGEIKNGNYKIIDMRKIVGKFGL